jgi:pSer/pThr/pTyr-binding forkhead associated (FHA) protein
MTGDDGTSPTHDELPAQRPAEVRDDGLSPNGSVVNGERVHGCRRLVDGDALRFGSTTLAYGAPYEAESGTIVTPRPPDTAEAG